MSCIIFKIFQKKIKKKEMDEISLENVYNCLTYMMKQHCMKVVITLFSLLFIILGNYYNKKFISTLFGFLLILLMYISQKLVCTGDKMKVLKAEREGKRERIGHVKRTRNYNGTGPLHTKPDLRQ